MLKISTNGVHVLAQSHFPSSQHAPPVFHARRKISPIYLRTADKDIFEACICPTGRGRYGAVALFMIEVAYFCRVPEHFPSLDDNEIRLPKLGICYAKRDWKTSILSAHRCQQTRYGDLSSIIQAILGHCLSPQTSPAARKIAGQSNVRPAPDLRQLLRVSAASISSESRTSRSLPTPTTIHLAQAVEDHFPRLSQYAPSFDPAVYEPEADIPSLARNVTLAQSRVIMRLMHPFPSNAGVRSLFDAVHLVQDDLDTVHARFNHFLTKVHHLYVVGFIYSLCSVVVLTNGKALTSHLVQPLATRCMHRLASLAHTPSGLSLEKSENGTNNASKAVALKILKAPLWLGRGSMARMGEEVVGEEGGEAAVENEEAAEEGAE
ncbi:hypothetical protein K525DRAFT_250115 [Schizophyllum commune Loenen D]|nr:hypothetical protein K525DRAFT_250115 [Schizophyllum commune Loenen D]